MRANQSHVPASDKATSTNDGSGLSSTGLFARLDPDGCWLKTCQGCSQLRLDGSSEPFSETWRGSGIMRSGICYRRTPLVPNISDVGFSLLPLNLWPTPTASDAETGKTDIVRFQSLDVAVRNGKVAMEAGGQLNPRWVEWLMGFPSGWTDLEPSETPLCPKSSSSSDGGL